MKTQLKSRKKIGFVLDNLYPSQLIFSLLNNCINNNLYDVNLFCDNITVAPIPINCGVFNISDCFGYCGPLISTSLKTTERILSCPSPIKYFYIWDLEWYRTKNNIYNNLARFYNNNSLTYITRNTDYKQLIESCWNNRIDYTIDNCDFLQNDEFLIDIEKQRISMYE